MIHHPVRNRRSESHHIFIMILLFLHVVHRLHWLLQLLPRFSFPRSSILNPARFITPAVDCLVINKTKNAFRKVIITWVGWSATADASKKSLLSVFIELWRPTGIRGFYCTLLTAYQGSWILANGCLGENWRLPDAELLWCIQASSWLQRKQQITHFNLFFCLQKVSWACLNFFGI